MSTDSAEKDAPCQCDYPYLGAQLAGTPTRCESCRRLVDDKGLERIEIAHAKSLRELQAWADANPLARPTPPASTGETGADR